MDTLASQFRSLHTGRKALVLPNAWDAGSARLFECHGAKAIATTSAGVSWSLGYADGTSPPIEWLSQVVASIVQAVKVPVSVDVEAGYSNDPDKAAENVMRIIKPGAVGINIEDGSEPAALLAAKIERIKNAAGKAGIDLFVNARTDVYLARLVPKERQTEETVTRAALYRKAGADGLFVPGLIDRKCIKSVVDQVSMPVNVMATPGLSSVDELDQLGVRRLSAGSAIAQCGWKSAGAVARDFLENGTAEPMASQGMAYTALQSLFTDRKGCR